MDAKILKDFGDAEKFKAFREHAMRKLESVVAHLYDYDGMAKGTSLKPPVLIDDLTLNGSPSVSKFFLCEGMLYLAVQLDRSPNQIIRLIKSFQRG